MMVKSFTVRTVGLLAVLACAFPAQGTDENKPEKLKALFELQYDKQYLEQSLSPIIDMFAQQQGVTDEALKKKFSQLVLEKYYAHFQKEFARVYGQHFTSTEIDEMIAYHSSSTGRKLVAKQSEMNTDLAKIGTSFMTIAQEVAQELGILPVQETVAHASIDFTHYAAAKDSQENPVVAKDLFENEIAGNELVVVKFSASWCPPCKTYVPIFEAVASELAHVDGKSVKYISIDIDAFPEIAEQWKVASIPTTIFYHQGKELEAVIGGMDKEKLSKKIADFCQDIPETTMPVCG